MRVLLIFGLTACTSLGPMPATTGVSALPAGRPSVEAQFGVMPGFMLSEAAHQAKGTPMPQLSALLDVDRWLLKGLILGAHLYGPDHDNYLEPYLGYRAHVTDRVSLGAVGYGMKGSGEDKLATYKATRFGGEAAADFILAQPVRWFTLHAQGTVGAQHVKASGSYCVDVEGVAKDCSMDPGATNTFVDGSLSGTYVAGIATLAADFGRLPHHTLHEVRAALMAGAGTMPRIRNGQQQSADTYATIGFALTIAFGAED